MFQVQIKEKGRWISPINPQDDECDARQRATEMAFEYRDRKVRVFDVTQNKPTVWWCMVPR